MRRGLVLGTLIGIGALSLAVSGQAPPAGPSAKALAAPALGGPKENLQIAYDELEKKQRRVRPEGFEMVCPFRSQARA